ncbi:3-deoxy-D-manno-octulosonic acid kinase [Salinicola aestuarinus]|uniref:3-deoxy-D-manno-octulosonic acid kinase n=1 Tax=Salinicola aestuarinus TaxID=1949082 RepID=UPI000DA14BE4|nr:3-deoxy-D-manno-octulosonic acid kinase [Salinicola aestuarinus]
MSLTTYRCHGTHILYDTQRLAQPDDPTLPPPGPAWLEPAAWQARGLVTGSAPGRGDSLFLQVAEQAWVVRPYRRGGMAARVSRARYVWPGRERTRAFRELRLTRTLHARGLPVPAPVAALVIHHGATYRGALITVRLPQTQALETRLETASPALLAEVGRTIRRFHDAGLDHVDLNARNVLIDADDRVWLIDFDRCRLRRQGAWRERNLARLARSLERFAPARAASLYQALRDGYQADAAASG